MSPWVSEILSRYVELIVAHAPAMAGQALAAVVLLALFAALWRWQGQAASTQRPVRGLGWAAVLVALVAGLRMAVDQASVVDDAFITLRYAQNLAEGHGLVWNHGEWVEGYTNFLWTVMLAVSSKVLPLELPLLALVGCLLSYVAVVVTLARASARLGGAPWVPPVAAMLYAVAATAVEYATTGLETTFATLCVLLGLVTLMSGTSPRRAAIAGGWLLLGVLNRPDHGLFWAAGGLVVLVESCRWAGFSPSVWLERRAWRAPVAFAATFAPYVAYLGWKLWYYGELLPNTYYAKSADLAYWDQGGIYTLTFLLGAHLWALIPIAVLACLLRPREPADRVLALFAAVSLPIYGLYVAKVGGDFMYGRFYVVTLPLWLLLVESALRRIADQRGPERALVAVSTVAVAATLGASAGGVPIIGPGKHAWYISNEGAYYQVEQVFPEVRIRHLNWHAGRLLHDRLYARGIDVPIATSGIGMVGYYSRLEVIDVLGLTDHTVARVPLKERGRPGHEKRANPAYLEARGVQIVRGMRYHPSRWRDHVKVDFGLPKNNTKYWYLLRYDEAFVADVKERSPDVGLPRFPREIDAWLKRVDTMSAKDIARDVRFFDAFYFSMTPDPRRRAKIRQVEQRLVRKKTSKPQVSGSEG